jgi:23S rRNA (guanosine2251-2'-O)-methyltransferase
MKYVILHDIRSHYNVGAIFRSADGAGVDKMLLTGYTPDPLDRFGRVVPEILKTSLGASAMVPWVHYATTAEAVLALQAEGVSVVAVEQSRYSVSLYDFVPPPNVAYIFGNEIEGVPAAILALCDTVLEIPMRGQKESLNVSVTAGIVLFQKPTI